MAFTGQPVYASIPIVKQAPAKGCTHVFGLASSGAVDRDQQIVDERFIRSAIAAWHGTSGGPVRLGHDPRRPVGKSVEIDGLWVKSAIYEKQARKLLRAGVLRAYSVGISSPRIVPDMLAKGGRIVDGELVEVSVVDSPSNVQCGITLIKAAPGGAPQFIGKSFVAKGARVGGCMVCGHSLKAHHRYCHGCGEKSPLFDEEAAMAKKAKKSYRKSMFKGRRPPGWVDPLAEEAAVTALLQAQLDSPDPGLRLGAEKALQGRMR